MLRSRFISALTLILFAGAVRANDSMSAIVPKDYFKARDINPTIDRMIDLAIADVDSPKAQIRHLAALKHLLAVSDEFKKAKNYQSNREAIEEIAEGKRGRDPAGFVQDYAKRLLAKLDGKKVAVEKTAPLRKECLDWFPSDVKLAGGLDADQIEGAFMSVRVAMLKAMSGSKRESVYEQLETMGNVRVDRVAFGVVDAENAQDLKVFIRLTGQANQTWLADAIVRNTREEFTVKKSKAPDGVPVTALHSQFSGAVIAFIGNTDLVVIISQNKRGQTDALLAEQLALRAKKKPHATDGPLKDRLAKIPDKAIGFLVGDIPNEMKRSLSMFEPMPAKIAAYLEPSPMGFDLKMESAMKDADEANKLVKKIGELRKAGVEELQKALKQPPRGMPLLPFQSMIKVLETVQVQSKEARVELAAFVGNELLRELGEMIISSTRDPYDGPPDFKKDE